MVNNVIGVVNYVIAARPSLLNFMIADKQRVRDASPAEDARHHATPGIDITGGRPNLHDYACPPTRMTYESAAPGACRTMLLCLSMAGMMFSYSICGSSERHSARSRNRSVDLLLTMGHQHAPVTAAE